MKRILLKNEISPNHEIDRFTKTKQEMGVRVLFQRMHRLQGFAVFY